MTKEPAVLFNGLGQIFAAVIPVLILFDLIHWTDKQVAGVMSLEGVVLAVLATWFIRTTSVSLPVANKQIEIAKAASIDTPTDKIIEQAKKEVA